MKRELRRFIHVPNEPADRLALLADRMILSAALSSFAVFGSTFDVTYAGQTKSCPMWTTEGRKPGI